jgi:hypothetical protein
MKMGTGNRLCNKMGSGTKKLHLKQLTVTCFLSLRGAEGDEAISSIIQNNAPVSE